MLEIELAIAYGGDPILAHFFLCIL
jgi:hypothetical protein